MVVIYIHRILLIEQFREHLGQFVAADGVLEFKDAHDMTTKLNNALENAIIETKQEDCD